MLHFLDGGPVEKHVLDEIGEYKKRLKKKAKNVNNTAIAFTAILLTPSDPSKTLASLDSNDKDERNRQEELFICPKFISNLEIKYQRHIVLKHRGKPGIQIKQQ